MKIYYNKNLKHLSRELRENSTLSEVLLWNEIRQGSSVDINSLDKNRLDRTSLIFIVPDLNLLLKLMV